MNKKSVIRIIEACILLVIGVLFCISKVWAAGVLSTILGIGLIIGGTVIVVLSIINEKALVGPLAIGGLLAITLGIFFIVANTIEYLMGLVPWLLIVFGSAMFIEAFLGYFLRKEKNTTMFVIKLIIGIVLIVLGILLLTVPEFNKAVEIILGVALIVVAFISIASEFIRTNRTAE